MTVFAIAVGAEFAVRKTVAVELETLGLGTVAVLLVGLTFFPEKEEIEDWAKLGKLSPNEVFGQNFLNCPR